jgi:hypothetical protein
MIAIIEVVYTVGPKFSWYFSQILDILALHLLVEHLQPSKDTLKKTDSRTKWLRQVCDFRPVVERILGHVILDTENEEFQYGERCQKGVEQVR